MKRSWLVGLALLGAQQASVAGIFGSDVDDQARQQVADLKSETQQQNRNIDKRMNALETSIKNLGLVEMVNQIEQLKEEIGKLRGQIELQHNQIETTQKRQRELYLDLDTRLRVLEKAPPATGSAAEPPSTTEATTPDPVPTAVKEDPKPAAPPVAATPPPAAPAPPSPPPTATVTPKPAAPPKPAATSPKPPSGEAGGDIRAYEDAHKTFRSGDYQGAVNSFRGFIEQFPSSLLASNAQYWIGISFYNLKDLRAALTSHQQLLKRYPESPKVPDSMLNIATIQGDLGDSAAARSTLEDIVAKYPGSEAATKARSRLAKRP